MITRPEETARVVGAAPTRPAAALGALAQASAAAASEPTLRGALGVLAAGVARAAGAEVAVIRVVDPAAQFVTAHAVASASPAVEAELEGTAFPFSELGPDEIDEPEALPKTVAAAAGRVAAGVVLQLPSRSGNQLDGSLELMRLAVPFSEEERVVARLAVSHAGLLIRLFRGMDALENDGA